MENLIGKPVLVHPMLTTDPADRQGHLGTISHVSYDNEVIEVSFADARRSLYATDALLVLKPPGELYRDMMEALRHMEAHDFKTLLRISMMLENGTPRQQHEALGMALANQQTLRFATMPLSSRLELTLPQDRDALWEKGLGR
ncbi:hypothetical protein ACS126_06420 [Sphingobacterium lactis]|uniref:hypothetical protein n=1 Tax=Sphingobacterium TaxID=28453 RepID=UPI00289A3C7D|nr:hypothetical protein [Sphingobacterium multivorum]